jgi:hypothetical protein
MRKRELTTKTPYENGKVISRMRRFMEDSGAFEIMIPVTWKYSLMEGYIHTFEEYELSKSDCFQFSIENIETEEEKLKLAHLLGYLPDTEINGLDYRSYPDNISEEDTLNQKSWTTIYGDKILLFSFTYDTIESKEDNPIPLEERIKTIHSVIASLTLFEDFERQQRLSSYRFEMFLQGIGATSVILRKAIENKAFIEATCILSNQVDSLLRTAIVLKKQLLNGNDKIELEWIYQGVSDKKKSEKDIYKKAKELNIIGSDIYDNLFKLYDDRNRVIHRFIISEITLAEVEHIAYDYYEIREKIKIIVDDIETEQVKQNVGMTVSEAGDPGDKSHHLSFVIGKIGKLNYFDEKDKEEEKRENV